MDNHNSGKGLTPEKKEEFKKMMGSYSGKIDFNKIREFHRDNFDDTYINSIDEECWHCKEHLNDVKNIFEDIDGHYVCGDCNDYWGLKAVKVKDFY